MNWELRTRDGHCRRSSAVLPSTRAVPGSLPAISAEVQPEWLNTVPSNENIHPGDNVQLNHHHTA